MTDTESAALKATAASAAPPKKRGKLAKSKQTKMAEGSDVRRIREQWYDVGGKRLRFAARAFDQEQFLQDGLQTGRAVWPCARLLVEYLSVQPAALLQRTALNWGVAWASVARQRQH
jgi:hypothetical protein